MLNKLELGCRSTDPRQPYLTSYRSPRIEHYSPYFAFFVGVLGLLALLYLAL
jgi:hypothetical protein